MKIFNQPFAGLKILFLFALTAFVVIGCNKDDDPDDDKGNPVASFQYVISTDNFLEVTFTNFSQNAASFEWNFGDGNSSSDKDPVHTFGQAGDYTVTLTATSSAGATAIRNETVSVEDPDAALARLAGATSKTWYLQREGIALGVGPNIADISWWSLGGAAPLGDRPCVLDDQYTFHRDGTWEFESNNTLFIDAAANGGWLDPAEPESCHDEDEPGVFTSASGADVSAFGNGGTYTYEYDAQNGTITLNGEGAYIGLASKTADGDNPLPVSVKEYTIFNFAEGDVADSLQMAIVGNGFAWNFFLVSYHDINDLPEIPGPKPAADFIARVSDYDVEFQNTSKNSTSYMWDFGDGNTSTEENPTHTYGAEGEYTVSLTAMDDMGNMDTREQVVTISIAVFSADVMSNASGKVWRLAGEGSYKVGPSPGSGEWWGGVDAQGVIDRACQMDDEFIFTDGGTMEYDAKGMVWAEAYMLGPDGCIDEAALVAPYDAFASGTHGFEVIDPAGGMDPFKVKVIGTGAFIGFSKPFNGGELDNGGTTAPVSEITYDVLNYSDSPTREVVTLAIDYAGDGSAWWTITIESLK